MNPYASSSALMSPTTSVAIEPKVEHTVVPLAATVV